MRRMLTLLAITAGVANAAVVRDRNPIPGVYIVVLEDKQFPLNRGKIRRLVGGNLGAIRQVYNHAIVGFSAELTSAQAERMSNMPFVRIVEEDGEGQISAAWARERLARRLLTDPVPGQLLRAGHTGAGVDAYVMDTGVLGTHVEFGGRVQTGRSFARTIGTMTLQPCGTPLVAAALHEDPFTLQLPRNVTLSDTGAAYTITKSGGTGTAWDSGASTDAFMEAFSDGYVQFTVPTPSQTYAIGFNDADRTTDPAEIDWHIRIQSGWLSVYAGAVLKASNIAVVAGSTYRIEKCATCVPATIAFKRVAPSPATLYSQNVGSFAGYRMDLSVYSLDATINDVRMADSLATDPVYRGDDPTCGGVYTDAANPNMGHGTGVASVLGGTTLGIAPGVTIVPVRTNRETAGVSKEAQLDGIEWIIRRHVKGTAAVANSSYYFVPIFDGPDVVSAVDLAFTRLVADGVFVTASANNFGDTDPNRTACLTSPSRVPRVISVGATDASDNIWSLSNTGPCVDMYAPGVSVDVAGVASNTHQKVLSGTSFSAPMVAGVGALYLQVHTNASPLATWEFIRRNATDRKPVKNGAGEIIATEPIVSRSNVVLPTSRRMPFAKAIPLTEIAPAATGDWSSTVLKGNFLPTTWNADTYVRFLTGPSSTPVEPISVSGNSATAVTIAPRWAGWWTALRAYAVGDVVIPKSTGPTPTAYRCITAGTSGATQPVWTTGVINDGQTVQWVESSLPSSSYVYPGTNYLVDIVVKAELSNDALALQYASGRLPRGLVFETTDSDWMNMNVGFQHSILRLMKHGIAAGCGWGAYCGSTNLLRKEVAVFLMGAAYGPEFPVQTVTRGDQFADIPAGLTDAYSNLIEQGGRDGILIAHDPATNRFEPDLSVTRYHMAKMSLAAKWGKTYVPKPAVGLYFDADDEIANGSEYPAWAEEFLREGISAGCGPGPDGRPNFCGDSTLTRREMTVFISAAFDLQCGAQIACP